MENKIREWLEKSGYPLELSAVEILNKYNYKSSPSSLYQDYETNKIREIDIIAHKRIESKEIEVEFKFIIECKKSNKPFILLTSNSEVAPISEIMFNVDVEHPTTHSVITAFKNLKFSDSIKKFSPAYAIGNKIIQGFVDSDEMVYSAVNSIAKSFKYFLESEKNIYEMDIEANCYSLSIPVLLIDAPFYKIFFDDTNSLQIQELEKAILKVKKSWEFETNSHYNVPIITFKNFNDFVLEVDNLMNSYLGHIKSMKKDYQIKNLYKDKINENK